MLLEKIQSPEDIKHLSPDELKELAYEIRARLIQVTSKTGGHVAPNLGTVELTLALHYVFHSPEDKLVWDVGHQAYVHKLLTGRNKDFDSLRQFHGVSGFPKRSESEHDSFGVGHASTSISAATGFAISRDQKKENNEVIAIIGDGSLTGGMAYEALDHAGHLGLNMTVILNDNDMSIDKNVGSMSEYLTRVRSDSTYKRTKNELEGFLKKIPALGPKMFDIADSFKDSLRNLVVPGSFFEELGFKYFGPINGHNLPQLISVLENSKNFDCPVLIHCITTKGKGYLPAEERPDKFHGTGAYDPKTGQSASSKSTPTYTDIFAKTMIALGKQDKRISGITAAMPSGTGIGAFAKQFPDRSYDVGIAEEHAVTMASAMALDGQKPVVAIYSTFLQRSFDQIIHDVALQNAPVIFALDRGGIVGEDGPTHHGVFDLSYLRMIPNMVVMAPKDENELQNMLYSATKYNAPTAIRYPRGKGLGVALDETFQYLEVGKSEVLQEGTDILMIAVGSMVHPATNVANTLEQKGYSVGIINARFIKPLDQTTLLSQISKAKHIITLEENVLTGGFGSAVSELLKTNGNTDCSILSIGIPDEFVPHGNTDILKKELQLDEDGILQQISSFLENK